jgi:hypothetical protein
MTFEWWFAYLLTSIILSLSPGSGAINTMTTSINHGYRGAAASIAGLQTGLGIHIVLVGIGLGTLFSRSVLAFECAEMAGCRLSGVARYSAVARRRFAGSCIRWRAPCRKHAVCSAAPCW